MKTISLLTAAGFLLVTLVFFALLFRQVSRAISQAPWMEEKKTRVRRRFLLALVGWSLVVSVVSLSGFTAKFDLFPLNFAPFLIPPLVAIVWISFFSKNTDDVLVLIPTRFILNLQVFRLFVELLLWAFFVQGLIGEQMTFEGRNLDILSGIFGPIVALFFLNSRAIRWLYNLIGLGLLINIVAVAILSMPTPFQSFTEGPANTVVATWPTVFLPAFLVPLAYGLHFLSMRQLQLTK